MYVIYVKLVLRKMLQLITIRNNISSKPQLRDNDINNEVKWELYKKYIYIYICTRKMIVP